MKVGLFISNQQHLDTDMVAALEEHLNLRGSKYPTDVRSHKALDRWAKMAETEVPDGK